MKKEFICKNCGKKFSPNYKYNGNRVMHFCSKSCKTTFQMQGYFNKSQLENSIRKLILQYNRYLTLSEVCEKLKISCKTISKFRVSILALNRELKMKKPQSMFEFKVGEILLQIYSDLVFQYTFDTCISPKGYLLKFDYFSKSNNLLIEADGMQHKNIEHRFSTDYTIQCDTVKNNWAKENGYKLIRIPYTRNVTKEYILNYL